jgi:hypothetical protein
VTVKLEASATLPAVLFERAETGAKPLNAAMLVTLCAFAAPPISRARRPIPHPSLFMAPLLLGLACLGFVGRFCRVIKLASRRVFASALDLHDKSD